MVFKNVEPEVWKHQEEGDFVEGFYLAMQKEVGEYKSNAYKIESEDGKNWVVFGNNVLDDKMQYAKVGDLIRIVFKGKVKGKKQEYNDYDLLIDDGKNGEETSE